MAKEPNIVEKTNAFAVKYGIVNNKGQYVSRSYLKAYIECNVRVQDECGFYTPPVDPIRNPMKLTRSSIIAQFMSDTYLSAHVGWIANAIGQECELSPLWEQGGAVTNRNATRQAEYKRRMGSVVTPPPTPEAQKALDDAAKRKQEIADALAAARKVEDDAAAVEARLTIVRNLPDKDVRRLLTINVDSLPAEFKAYVLQLREDWKTIQAEIKSAKTTVDA